jgi:pimeloyl-ACP methyl ester carboxylesterase
MASALRTVAWLLFALVLATVLGWWLSKPATPDAFYATPSNLPAEPGTLIRTERFVRAVPQGAIGWRILYTTTRANGAQGVASAIVMTSGERPDAPRPVVAWAHGTTGIAPGCAPSVLADPFQNVPAVGELIREKWIYVATDYPGLGTSGGHAYLVGEDAARAVLDAVRAARRINGLSAAAQTVVWGHSQGGHSALWTGIRAPSYAPDVGVAGIAALAPASDLPTLFVENQSSTFGKIVSAYLSTAYAKAFPTIDMPSYVSPGTQLLVDDIATRCVAGASSLFSVAETFVLPPGGIFMRSPADGPLGDALRANTPRDRIEAPVLIAQGEADDLVFPDIQAAYVIAQCTGGQPLDYRTYKDEDHVSLVAPDSPLTPDLVAWTRDRFEGKPAPTACPPLHEH